MGMIFNIQKFCTNDGPGIRTTVFFKGCPLRCVWCHNPESQSFSCEMAYNAERCVGCGKCVTRCPNQCHIMKNGVHSYLRKNCTACKQCVHPTCPAMEFFGYEASPEEILSEVMKDAAFYQNSGGGLTLSGGEPLGQPAFCLALLRSAKEKGLHVCMETCGFAKQDLFATIAENVDLFLYDYKETDSQKHKTYTGVDNSIIMENLRYLDSIGKPVILRCPIIPTYNDSEEHLNGIAQTANNLACILKIELEPYHRFGLEKYKRLDRDAKNIWNLEVPEQTRMEQIIDFIRKRTKTEVFLA